ncbi:hypothetical protein [Halobacteriovorax sp. ZH1_bin.1]|uniref:hypothetical protein n=1 Tax=Halobacteriovorax sp. ZH1_bin.1 TaxID=3157723 RepID=UPI003711FADC
MFKKLYLIMLLSNIIFAGTGDLGGVWRGTGDLTDDWRTLPIIEVEERSGDDLRSLNSGDFKFDSLSDRWLLKTKSRVLSVENIELIDSYKNKQIEVEDVSFNVKRARKNMSANILKRRILTKVKFKNYKIEDFNY